MMSSLDTNVLMRYIWADLPEQYEKATKLIDKEDQTFYVSDMVVAEIIHNLKISHIRRSSLVGTIEKLAGRKNIVMSSFVLQKVLPYYAEHPALSFVDCYVAMEAEEKGREPLWTFDRKLANQHTSAKMIR